MKTETIISRYNIITGQSFIFVPRDDVFEEDVLPKETHNKGSVKNNHHSIQTKEKNVSYKRMQNK